MPRRFHSALALVAALALTLCAARPAVTSHAAPADGLQDMLVLRSGTGSQAAFLAQTTGGLPSLSLPLGILDRTGHTLYAAQDEPSGSSLIRAIDVASGRTLRQLRINGSFSSRSGDYSVGSVWPLGVNGSKSPPARGTLVAPASAAPSAHVAIPARGGYPADGSQVLTALSFNGRWLALRSTDSDQANTRVVVIDTGAMRPVADQRIGGAFGLDAIGNDGRLVYLIQSLPARGFGVYQVRSYQVGHASVDARVVVAPGEVPGSMSGEAWSRAWSPDGSWLYTLYVQSDGHVFVHALHLAARETRCIDFPALSNSVQEASHFTLSVAPDGRALYAVNPVLGLAVAVRALPGGKVIVAHLRMRAGSPQRTQSAAAIAPDGRTVFVATGAGVWAIDVRALTLRQVYVRYQEVASVALSGDGQRLYALSLADQSVDVLTPATGAFTNSLTLQGGWAIEAVMAAS